MIETEVSYLSIFNVRLSQKLIVLLYIISSICQIAISCEGYLAL